MDVLLKKGRRFLTVEALSCSRTASGEISVP